MDMEFPQHRVMQVHVGKSWKLNSSGWGMGSTVKPPGMDDPGGWGQTGKKENICERYQYFLDPLIECIMFNSKGKSKKISSSNLSDIN